MLKHIKLLAIIAIILGSLTIINGMICLLLIVINMTSFGYIYLYLIIQVFFIVELYLLAAAACVLILLQSLWIYYQINNNQNK